MQKNTFLVLLSIVFIALSLSACKGTAQATPTSDPNIKVTEAVLTVYAQMTESAAEAPPATPTHTLEPSPTPTFVQPTQIPTQTPTSGTDEDGDAVPTATTAAAATQPPTPTTEPQASMPCLRANLEYETIPDGTEMFKGQEFTKMWRLKNTGSCPWNKNFVLRFVDGEIMNAPSRIPLTDENVPTWGIINIEVDMTAPSELGTHKGYWMIISDDGKIFGINPDGAGWFWVEIEVIAE